MRFEPPAPHVARYVTRDVELYGQTVPEGSAMMMLIGAAVRDHRQFPPDGDVFDIHREQYVNIWPSASEPISASALRWPDSRVAIALEEILKRFPEWDVDMAERHALPDIDCPRLGVHASRISSEIRFPNDELRLRQ